MLYTLKVWHVVIDKNSQRLQSIRALYRMGWKRFYQNSQYCKGEGKVYDRPYSPAGAWLMYRGHLDRLSDNLLLGAVNAFRDGEVGNGLNLLNKNIETFSHIAREYKQNGLKWIIVGDQNYGEGSSSEHAAMTPRYLDVLPLLQKVLPEYMKQILKKQGILALTFVESSDYEKIRGRSE